MTILIKNIQLVDGSGKPAAQSDVLIKNNKISAIESVINYKAGEIIDGMGAYLAPGFIDAVGCNERNLDIFLNPEQENLLKQGITTVIGGHGGFSLAPLIYGSLETFRPWADTRKINVNWHTFAEFLKTFSKKKSGLNFGSLVGHTTVRFDIVHDAHQRVSRELTKNEIAVLNFVMKKSLKEGAFGISVGLDSPLVSEASYFEIKKLAELTAEFGALFSLRLKDNRDGFVDNVRKAVFLAKETGAKIFINDFRLLREAFDLIESDSGRADICFKADIAPDDFFFSEEAVKILKSDKAIIPGSGFLKFLAIVEKEKIMPLEEAVRKIAFLPAEKIGLKKRGLIKEGYFADLVIFKNSQIREVILNGKRVVEDGKYLDIFTGEALRREI